jgi:phage internal scaffolding protein
MNLYPVKDFYCFNSEKLVLDMEFPADSEYTDQSYKGEADINTIMARYQSTGEIPVLNGTQGQWLDVTGMDFQSHMDFLLEAQQLFDDLPSAIRDRFGNDPAAFLDFTSNEANTVEIAKMGLLTPEATDRILYPAKPVEAAPASKAE